MPEEKTTVEIGREKYRKKIPTMVKRYVTRMKKKAAKPTETYGAGLARAFGVDVDKINPDLIETWGTNTKEIGIAKYEAKMKPELADKWHDNFKAVVVTG